MNTTILLFHPHLKTSRVNKTLAEAAIKAGFNVRALYDIYPDEQIDVKKEQALLESSDRIVLQFPLYWYSSPSLLKKWEDLVLEHGWAYGSTGNKLRGKELLLAVSVGASIADYQHDTKNYTLTELLRPFQVTSNFIGTKYLQPFFTTSALSISEAKLKIQAKKYVSYLQEKTLNLANYE